MDTGHSKVDAKRRPKPMNKSYKEGYWIFIYYPDEDFLMMLFKGVRKGFWPYGTPVEEAATGALSEKGKEHMRDKNWQSYFIDTELTKDWKEAYAIAGIHFGMTYVDGLRV